MLKIKNQSLESILSYKFNDKSILKLALTHSSSKSTPSSYQRLEFLGDSIINFIVSEWLFFNKKKGHEGDLTTHKSFFVSRKNMSLIGQSMSLIDYVIINKSVDLSSSKTVNKINSDLYESIVGAIYLDSDYETVKNFIYRTLINFKSFVDYNYKGQLNQLCHQKKIKEPEYNLIHDSGPDHNKEYKVSVCVNNKKFFGSGGKIKEAEIEAAKNALIDLFCF